jgi:3D (Asp-Asp-Asp) domain-containing protein
MKDEILKKVTIMTSLVSLSIFVILAGVEISQLHKIIDFQKETIQIHEEFVMALIEQNEGLIATDPPVRISATRVVQAVVDATVTSYSPHKRQADGDPRIAASMRPVREGTVAVSRDLFWAGWTFGRRVYIEGLGVFEINDLMNERFERRIDVFQWSKQKALAFGAVERRVALLGE